MLARVVTIEGRPEKVEDGIRYFREKLIPTAKSSHGFKDAYLMVDRKSGKILSVVTWESENDIQESAAGADKITSERGQVAGAKQKPKLEVYEVAVAEVPTGASLK